MKIKTVSIKPEVIQNLIDTINRDPDAYHGDYISSVFNSSDGAIIIRKDQSGSLLVSKRLAVFNSGMVYFKVPKHLASRNNSTKVNIEFHVANYIIILMAFMCVLAELLTGIFSWIHVIKLRDLLIVHGYLTAIIIFTSIQLYFEFKRLKVFFENKLSESE